MSGRKDYQERQQMKKDRYEELADKARRKSKEQSDKHHKIANNIPMGQPILVDHYSANKHRNDIRKMERAIENSIAEDEKADYYDSKVSNIENNNTISSDDPEAIQKLEQKLQTLEDYKTKVKAREHQTWELSNINQQMRSIRERLKELKELEDLQFDDISFNGGKVIHNADVNRIQFIFDNIPDEKIRDILKHRGFKWSRYNKAWQRLYNKNGITATRWVLDEISKLDDNN